MPQILHIIFLSGAGTHTVEIKAIREDSGKEAMTLSIYKSYGGKLLTELNPKMLLAESEATSDRSSTSINMEALVGGLYVVLLSCDKPGVEGKFKIICTTNKEEPKMTGLVKQTVVRRSQWDPAKGRCGGYGKSENPQFSLDLPEGEHQVEVVLNRIDKKMEDGIIFWVFKHDGDLSKLAKVATADAVGASPFIKGHTVDGKFNLNEGKYMIMCSIQATDSEAKFTLTTSIEGTTSKKT